MFRRKRPRHDIQVETKVETASASETQDIRETDVQLQALVPADYVPVYPYDDVNTAVPVPMPAFYDSRYFTQSAPMVLAPRYGSGGGGEGGGGGSAAFDPSTLVLTIPLYYGTSSGLPSLALGYGSGLTVESDKLVVRQSYRTPLTESDNIIGLNVGSGLEVDTDGNLTVLLQATDPIAVTNNQLSFKLGQALALDVSGNAGVYTSDPLSVNSNNQLALSYGQGLQVNNRILGLKLTGPLSLLTDGSAGLSISSGLQVLNGALSLKVSNPLTFEADGKLSIKLGPGMKLLNETLTLALSRGLTTDPQGQVEIQTGLGLEKDNNGYLTVKIGPGLFYDTNGAINARTGGGTVLAPVKPLFLDTSGNLTLLMGRGLETESSTGRLEVKLGNSLYFDADGSINVTGGGTSTPIGADPPLLMGTNGHVQLALGKGVETIDNALQVKLGEALYFDENGAINVTAEDTVEVLPPLKSTEGSLSLLMEGALYTNPVTNALALNYGQGLALNNDSSLSVLTQSPLSITQDQKVGLNIGRGLETTQSGALEAKLGANLGFDTAGRITFGVSAPIYSTDNTVGLRYRPPLVLNNNSLSLNLDDGLIIYQNRLRLATQNPLKIYPQGISLNYTAPFIIQQDMLGLNIGAGLQLSSTTRQLEVSLGPGLEVINGKLTHTPPILWTGPLPTQNLKIGIVEVDCFIVLQKNGPIINGMVQLTHLRGTILPVSECILRFTSEGKLDESASSLDKPWGWWHPRHPEIASPIEDDPPNVKLTDMMPSPVMYGPSNLTFSMANIFNMSVNTTAPVVFSAEFNTRTDDTHPYSIRFVWIQNKDYSYVNINYSTAYFSYYCDELLGQIKV